MRLLATSAHGGWLRLDPRTKLLLVMVVNIAALTRVEQTASLVAFVCAALLLDHIGETDGARVLNQAIETYLERASTAEKPVEMGGEALSPQVGEGVIRCL